MVLIASESSACSALTCTCTVILTNTIFCAVSVALPAVLSSDQAVVPSGHHLDRTCARPDALEPPAGAKQAGEQGVHGTANEPRADRGCQDTGCRSRAQKTSC